MGITFTLHLGILLVVIIHGIKTAKLVQFNPYYSTV